MKTRLFCIFFLLLCTLSYGQQNREFRINQYTTRDGLAVNAIRTLHQDRRGFIWLGLIDGGVCRFDGHEFKQIICEDGSSLLSDDSNIISFKEDRMGHIWIETYFSGVACYDIYKECFVDYYSSENKGHFRNVEVFDNEAWLYNKSSGDCLRVKFGDDGSLSCMSLSYAEGTLPSEKIFYIQNISGGSVYIGTRKGLVRVRDEQISILDDEKFFVGSHKAGERQYHIDNRGCIYEEDITGSLIEIARTPDQNELVAGTIASQDHWYIFSQERSYSFSFAEKKVKVCAAGLNISNASLDKTDFDYSLAYDKSGKVFYYDRKSDRVSSIDLAEAVDGLGDRPRLRFTRNREGRLLIAVNGSGLVEYTPVGGAALINLEERLNDPQANFVLDVINDRRGNVWLATMYCGLIKLTPTPNGIHFIRVDEEKSSSGISNMIKSLDCIGEELLVSAADGKSYYLDLAHQKFRDSGLNHSNIYCCTMTEDGTPVLGSNGRGLKIGDELYLRGRKVYDVISDDKDRLWVALLEGGLDLAEKGTDGSYSFRQFFTESYPYPSFRSLHKDKEGRIWAGGNLGLYMFKTDELMSDSSSFIVYNKQDGSLKSNKIIDIEEDDEGRIWIAESGSGIACISFDEKNEAVIRHYGPEDGLINNRVRDLQFDNNGDLWIMTDDGLSRFLVKSGSFVNHHLAANDHGNTHNSGATILHPSGLILSGTNDGLLCINPELLRNTAANSRDSMYFTSFKLDGDALSASFSAMDFDDDTQYSHMLEAYDKDWSQASRENSVKYENLPPGNYKLKIRASSRLSGSREIQTELQVKSPILHSAGAKIIFLLIVLIILAMIYKTRRENVELKTQVEESDKVRDIWRKQISEKNDDEFLLNMSKVMNRYFSNVSFTIDDFASEMAMSRTTFYAKVNEVTGGTPNKYIRNYRLKKATEFLLNSKSTVEEVAYMCGFKDSGYFSRIFKEEYGMTPREYKSRATK